MAFNPKLMAELDKLDGVVLGEHDIFANGIESPSPSLNYIFDNTWRLPDGLAVLLGGEPKGGKSVLMRALIGSMHQADPEAVALVWNTEFREKAQVSKNTLRTWGIDPARYRAFETNRPENIFDPIEKLIPKLIQNGLKVKLVAIDSVNEIQGRRAMNADTILTQQIGDEAKTLQDGFKRIKEVLRKHNITTILTCQVRAEMDMAEQMRGNKVKLAVPWYVKHFAEYFVYVERLRTKAGKTDLTGKEYRDTTTAVDLTGQGKGDGDEAAHKIRVRMMDSSVGRPGRIGVFTIDHDHGIVNTHEEVFLLGVGFGVLDTSKRGYFGYAPLDRNYHGKEACLEALRDDSTFRAAVLRDCKKVDIDRKNGVKAAPTQAANEGMSDADLAEFEKSMMGEVEAA
jgi:RecA/RadA recombinase